MANIRLLFIALHAMRFHYNACRVIAVYHPNPLIFVRAKITLCSKFMVVIEITNIILFQFFIFLEVKIKRLLSFFI